ncbi:MAG: 16S rRNA processing protein RimM [Deltaproteobacteria bacterium]|nr:16S rRNA processing protein RimM [Deltaproteobacteria bacterium]
MNQDPRISDDTCQLIELGKIGRPHGVNGEMRLFLHNPSSESVYQLDSVFLRHPESSGSDLSPFKVHNVKQGPRFHILSLKDVRNRDSAQALNGMLLLVPRDVLPVLDEDEFYVADLMGIEVFCEGQFIGKIVDSRAQGGIEVISVESDEREIQIPFVDEYVERRDIPGKTIEVKNIDDLPIYAIPGKGQ